MSKRYACAAFAFLAATGAGAAGVRVAQPPPEATVFSNQGNVDVRIRTDSPLSPGERVQLWVDGLPVPPATRSMQFELTGLPRGGHSVRALVVDEYGRQVEASPPVRFYVWKASRLFPNRRG